MKRIINTIASTILVLTMTLALPQQSFARDVNNLQIRLEKIDHIDKEDPLSLWNNNAKAKKELNAFIKAITNKNGKEFIPIKDRIAVFDFDGTLFCETDPNYFDYMLLEYRVLEDPKYKNKASIFERKVANMIKEQNETGKSFNSLPVDHGKAVASAFSGMTIKEFNSYIQEFKKQPMPSYKGMLRGDGFYLPMVQLVEYLQANNFQSTL